MNWTPYIFDEVRIGARGLRSWLDGLQGLFPMFRELGWLVEYAKILFPLELVAGGVFELFTYTAPLF